MRQDDVFFEKLQQLISSIKDNILQLNVNSKQERSRQLNEADKQSRQIKAAQQSGNAIIPTEEDFEHDPILRDINNTYRITSIIGQIVKNQRDTVERPRPKKIFEKNVSKICTIRKKVVVVLFRLK